MATYLRTPPPSWAAWQKIINAQPVPAADQVVTPDTGVEVVARIMWGAPTARNTSRSVVTLVSRWSMSRVSRPPTAQLRPAWGRLLRRVRG